METNAIKTGPTKNKGLKGFFNESTLEAVFRALLVVALLFLFLVGVSTLSGSLKLFGADFANTLFNISSNAFVSLMAGMLATVLFQSSSVTTAIIVGLVSSGSMTISGAVPMIMGANIGTSVTNTLVSLGYMRNTASFKRSFAAATVHDFFNLLSVAVILPLELAFGFLEKISIAASAAMYGAVSGIKYKSPIKAAIKPVANGIKSFVTKTLGFENATAGIILLVLSGVIILFALSSIVKSMKPLIESNKGEIINKMLSKNTFFTILFGTGLTIAVQSSSITTSLLIPMAGSGLLSLASIFPITIGANIGTTATALLAALTGNAAGLSIALVHFFFNIAGTLIWFAPKKMRKAPIVLAEGLGKLVAKNKMWGLTYVAVVFFFLPVTMIWITK